MSSYSHSYIHPQDTTLVKLLHTTLQVHAAQIVLELSIYRQLRQLTRSLTAKVMKSYARNNSPTTPSPHCFKRSDQNHPRLFALFCLEVLLSSLDLPAPH